MNIRETLKSKANKDHAVILQRFFKTGKGEYGEGDIFIGLKVPLLRSISKQFKNLSFKELEELITSPIHEERLISLFILIEQYKKADEPGKEKIAKFYLKNLKYINNWDLIDLSADRILGAFLFEKNKDLLFDFASSQNLWKKRISVMSTFHFIKMGKFDTTLKIVEMLLNDKHDLIHKATGWMLREIGKRDTNTEEKFLKKYYKKMPRTMLRYAIEKFPEERRLAYLKGTI